ncbi:MAG: (d)CMP kinase [Proteobacteria bacterium]|nr:(d)CMP kinase [Pseudomonadota bacterium]MBU1737555.1 (d)CMP kinase [Pseudomonadota bacterium]
MAGSRIVTIDGPSGAGKSTISSLLAAKLGFAYLDTGAMYRAVGLKVHNSGIDPEDEGALESLLDELDLKLQAVAGGTSVLLDQEDVSGMIRTPEMSMIASRISALRPVREKLTALQREIGGKGEVVTEGRDMGTVVFPDARWKFFLDASPQERARRRVLQLQEKGQVFDEGQILEQIVQRDEADSARSLSPLKPAEDAVIVDSSKMTIDEVIHFMVKCIQAADR